MTPTELIHEAADVIRERGWVQHRIRDEKGRVCAVGAIDTVAAPLWPTGTGVRRAALRLLRLTADSSGRVYSLTSWNDRPGRTKEEVLALFEQAEKNARMVEAV